MADVKSQNIIELVQTTENFIILEKSVIMIFSRNLSQHILTCKITSHDSHSNEWDLVQIISELHCSCALNWESCGLLEWKMLSNSPWLNLCKHLKTSSINQLNASWHVVVFLMMQILTNDVGHNIILSCNVVVHQIRSHADDFNGRY